MTAIYKSESQRLQSHIDRGLWRSTHGLLGTSAEDKQAETNSMTPSESSWGVASVERWLPDVLSHCAWSKAHTDYACHWTLSSPTKLFVTSGTERQPVSQSEAKDRHAYLYI